MRTVLALVVCAVFIGLALWHVRMAFGALTGESGAVPTVEGKPLFVPSRRATLLVAVALLLLSALVAGAGDIVQVGIQPRLLSWLCFAVALGLLARAVGDFKYVGFFKRVRNTKFARMDTLVYSPLCVLLAVGIVLVASAHAT